MRAMPLQLHQEESALVEEAAGRETEQQREEKSEVDEKKEKERERERGRENEPARALGFLFGQLDFRVTRIMILVAAAGSRIALCIDPRGCGGGAVGAAAIRSRGWIGQSVRSEEGIRETCQERDREERLTFARAGSVGAKPGRLNSRDRKMQTSHAVRNAKGGAAFLAASSFVISSDHSSARACARISTYSAAIGDHQPRIGIFLDGSPLLIIRRISVRKPVRPCIR